MSQTVQSGAARRAAVLLSAAALLLVAPTGVHGQGRPAQVQGAVADVEVVTLSRSVVETVDLRSRQVLLRVEDGALLTYVAGPEVRNLPQVRPGDVVEVDLIDSVAVTWIRGGETVQPGVGDAVVRAAPGQRPGAGQARATRLVARVEQVETDTRRVLLRDTSNRARRVLLPSGVRPEDVRVGDQVVVDLTEALLVRVRPR